MPQRSDAPPVAQIVLAPVEVQHRNLLVNIGEQTVWYVTKPIVITAGQGARAATSSEAAVFAVPTFSPTATNLGFSSSTVAATTTAATAAAAIHMC